MNIFKWRILALSPVFLLSFLLLFLGASAAWYVQHLYQGLSDVLDLNVASVRAAEELEIGLREIRSSVNDFAFDDTQQDFGLIMQLKRDTDKWLREAEILATTSKEQELIRQIKAGYSHFFEELGRASTFRSDQPAKQTLRRLTTSILTKEIIAPTHEYLDFNEGTMVAVAQQHRIFSNRFALAMLIIGVCGSAGGFFAGHFSSRRMKRTMVELNLPLSAAAGKLAEVAGPIRLDTSLDLRELKRILEAIAREVEKVVMRLQTTQQEVMKSEKLAAIGRLAAGTAHEIRNPLMSIKLLIQATLATPQEVVLSEQELRLIEKEISRLERTVQNLLDFARPPVISRTNVSLRNLIQRCTDLVSGRASIQTINIRKSCQGADYFVEGDSEQLSQVILNLLINSLQSTPPAGEITVSMELEAATESRGERVKVSVQDTGLGIPEQILPVAFEPFISGKESGTGLGLSISKQIIEAHSGEVFAHNLDEGGAVVGFLLPRSSHYPHSIIGVPNSAAL